MKKILAAVLAPALMLSLCACGKTEIQPIPEALVTPEPVQSLDWDAAFAAHGPDEVVFTVGESAVTWQELFYEVAYCTTALEYSSGVTIDSWDIPITDDKGEAVSCGDYVLQTAVAMLHQYHVVDDRLTQAGVVLDEEALAELENYKNTVLRETFAGDRAAFLAYIESLYGTEELWDWFNEVDMLYNEGFDHLYGPGGENYPAEDTLAYGEEYGYVNIKQIYLYNNSEAAADMGLLLTELEALKGEPEALEARFDELFSAHNENLALLNYPEGWCVYAGDTEEEIYRAALAMGEYSFTVVETADAEVLLLRIPVEADSDVYFDVDNGVMRDLCYYAAWQDYSDLINGPGGWLQSTETLAVSGFEDLRLQDLF